MPIRMFGKIVLHKNDLNYIRLTNNEQYFIIYVINNKYIKIDKTMWKEFRLYGGTISTLMDSKIFINAILDKDISGLTITGMCITPNPKSIVSISFAITPKSRT